MTDPLFSIDTPMALQMAARQERDRYLANLIRAGARALWTALFGSRESAHDAAVTFQDCYVKERGLIAVPDSERLAARRCNDHAEAHDAGHGAAA